MLAHPWLQVLAGTAPNFLLPPPPHHERPSAPHQHHHHHHHNLHQQRGQLQANGLVGGGGEVHSRNHQHPRFSLRPGSCSPTVPPTSNSSSGHHHHHHHHHHGASSTRSASSVAVSTASATGRLPVVTSAELSPSDIGVAAANLVGQERRPHQQGHLQRSSNSSSLLMDVCFLESEIKRLHRWSLASKFSSTKPVPQAIRCTTHNCNCECFHPGKTQARLCENCRHGWVSHALDKLGNSSLSSRHSYNSGGCHAPQVELVQPSIAFDVASLMLFGTQALPIRLKILLDRLFSVLNHDDVSRVLHGFGWTYEDYARGYILQDTAGNVLDRWILATREEEPLILQQFLRFGETKAIAQHLLLQETVITTSSTTAPSGSGSADKPEGGRPSSVPRMGHHDSEIKKFIERTNRVTGSALFKHAALLAASSANANPTTSVSTSALASNVTVSPTCNNSTLPTTSTVSLSSLNLPLNRARPFRIPSSVSSTHSLSPPGAGSPTPGGLDCRSPLPIQSSSPLNKLQNMQPCDFRRDKMMVSPDSRLMMEPGSLISSTQHATPLSSPTSSAPTISSMHSVSGGGYANHLASVTTGMSDTSATDCETDDDSGHAINLSRSSNPGGGVSSHLHDSIYAARKVRHLRKSANPMRRRWNPIVLSTLTTNPATGKKRVQCHVCLKTFCDKGALKIHFSAVHLREMHKCTVEGCNMMFSSRRSRNRHSANPNPKLHTPNYRRKINPHDGRSANPYPIIPPSALLNLHNNNNNNNNNHGAIPGLGPLDPDRPFLSLEEAVRVESKLNEELRRNKEDNNNPGSLTVSREPSLGRESRKSSPERSPPALQTVDGVLALTKKPRLSGSNFEETLLQCHQQLQMQHQNNLHNFQRNFHQESTTPSSHPPAPQQQRARYEGEADVSNGAEEGMNLSLKDHQENNSNRNVTNSSAVSKGVRKRKSMNPTRCTAVTSDDDLEYVTTDDSSSDTYIDHLDENGMLNSKSDDDLDDDDLLSSDDLGDDSKDYFYNRNTHLYKRTLSNEESFSKPKEEVVKNNDPSTPISFPPREAPEIKLEVKADDQRDVEVKDQSPTPKLEKPDEGENNEREEETRDDKNEMKSPRASCPPNENEMSDINAPSSENPLRHLESLSLGAFNNMAKSRGHFGSGLPMQTSSGVSFHAPGLGLASSSCGGGGGCDERPRSASEVVGSMSNVSTLCPQNANSSDQESYSEQMSLLPAFRDASLVGSLEIPVDKENPRRCTACGKIFQNHFGVKTHYQNVHLKLMHKCTVEGCNAAFPSKRSRDRHSANLNLHRKLLSTSSDKGSPFLDKSALYPYHSAGAQLRDDFFSRLYDPQGASALQPLNFADIYPGRLPPCNPEALVAFPNHLGPLPFHPAFMTTPTSTSRLTDALGGLIPGLGMNPNAFLPGLRGSKESPSSSLTATPSPRAPSSSQPPSPALLLNKDDNATGDGHEHRLLSCEFCPEQFRETDTLRDHYENYHARELLAKVQARPPSSASEDARDDNSERETQQNAPTESKMDDDDHNEPRRQLTNLELGQDEDERNNSS